MSWLALAVMLPSSASAAEACTNAADDDADGLTDCADPDCGLRPLCCAGDVTDSDGDGWCDTLDRCDRVPDPAQADADGDGTGDACDACPGPGDGLSLFSPPMTVTSRVGAEARVAAGDLDGDGDADALSTGSTSSEVTWTESLGGGAFGPRTVLTAAADGVTAILPVDLDLDGDLDVVSTSSDDDEIAWYPNAGGTFLPPQVLGTEESPLGVAADDLDGDADVDLLVVGNTRLVWLPGLGGGLFGAAVGIGAPSDGVDAAATGDLDGDGDADVLVATASTVGWFENHGGGAFASTTRLLDTDFERAGSILAVDLDGDGDLDAVASSDEPVDPHVAWYPNLGGGVFGPKERIASASFPSEALAADLDGDGDLDLLSAGPEQTSWIESLGGGAFAAPAVLPGTGDHHAAVADVDADGDLDVIGSTTELQDVVWHANVGACRELDTDADGLPDASELLVHGTRADLADTDGDGLDDGDELDVGTDPLVGDSDGDGALDGADPCPLDPLGDLDADGVCSDVHDCAEAANPAQDDADGDGVGDACDLCLGDDATGDPDGDGVCSESDGCDLVADPDHSDLDRDGTGDACDRCPGPGNGLDLFSPVSHRITDGIQDFDLADVDGDGDLDAVTSERWPAIVFPYESDLGSVLWWRENLGTRFGVAQQIQSLRDAYDVLVVAADVDADGDPDLVHADPDGAVLWTRNTGAGFEPFAAALVAGPSGDALAVADLDGDGDLDVLSELGGHENLGAGAAWTEDAFPGGRAAEDVDGDGDLDILAVGAAVAGGDGDVTLAENLGGGTFAPAVPIADAAGPIDLGDLDGDGDPDLVVGEAWYANLGGGAFGARTELEPPRSIGSVQAADLEGDGDVDLLVAVDEWMDAGDRVVWYENLGGGSFAAARVVDEVADPHRARAADLEGDGDLDLFTETSSLDVRLGRPACFLQDSDADGLTDAEELLVVGTDPDAADTDRGSLADGLEVAGGADPTWGGDDLPPAELVLVANGNPGPYRFRVDGMSPGYPVRLLSSASVGDLVAPACTHPTPIGLAPPLRVEDDSVADAAGSAVLRAAVPPAWTGTRWFVVVQPASCRVSDVAPLTVP